MKRMLVFLSCAAGCARNAIVERFTGRFGVMLRDDHSFERKGVRACRRRGGTAAVIPGSCRRPSVPWSRVHVALFTFSAGMLFLTNSRAQAQYDDPILTTTIQEAPIQTRTIQEVTATLKYDLTITGGDQPVHASGTIGPVACTGLDPTMLWAPSEEGLKAYRTVHADWGTYQDLVGLATVGAGITTVPDRQAATPAQSHQHFSLKDGASVSAQTTLTLKIYFHPETEWPPVVNSKPNCSLQIIRFGPCVIGDGGTMQADVVVECQGQHLDPIVPTDCTPGSGMTGSYPIVLEPEQTGPVEVTMEMTVNVAAPVGTSQLQFYSFLDDVTIGTCSAQPHLLRWDGYNWVPLKLIGLVSGLLGPEMQYTPVEGSDVWPGKAVDTGKPTVVLVHGWNSDKKPFKSLNDDDIRGDKTPPPEWERPLGIWRCLAEALKARVNILAWDWQFEARSVSVASGVIRLPIENVDIQGRLLATALGVSFAGTDYAGPVQFTGHSLGGGVAAYAGMYQATFPDSPMSRGGLAQQVTLFDVPERAGVETILGIAKLVGSGLELRGPARLFLDGDPLPTLQREGVRVDNYWTCAGCAYQNADQNVFLGFTPSRGHGYPRDWYLETIKDANRPKAYGVDACGPLDRPLDVHPGWAWSVANREFSYPGEPEGVWWGALDPYRLCLQSDPTYCDNIKGPTTYHFVPRGQEGNVQILEDGVFLLVESSSASIWGTVDSDGSHLALEFQYAWLTPGDGDTLRVYLDDVILWEMQGAALGASPETSPMLELAAGAGQTTTLKFELHSTGEPNAVVTIWGIQLLEIEGSGCDGDGDGVCDIDDNCPDTMNADQTDSDGDGVGDACDGSNGSSGPTVPNQPVPGGNGSDPNQAVPTVVPCATAPLMIALLLFLCTRSARTAGLSEARRHNRPGRDR